MSAGTITEKCSCGATITVTDRGGMVLAGYQARDFREAHRICRQPTIGRCGAKQPIDNEPRSFCALPDSHKGWHRDDNGMEWTLASEDSSPVAQPDGNDQSPLPGAPTSESYEL